MARLPARQKICESPSACDIWRCNFSTERFILGHQVLLHGNLDESLKQGFVGNPIKNCVDDRRSYPIPRRRVRKPRLPLFTRNARIKSVHSWIEISSVAVKGARVGIVALAAGEKHTLGTPARFDPVLSCDPKAWLHSIKKYPRLLPHLH